jgi:phenylpropionate dioxygenase-like ring-hydroxylating dioxygenase large terminal subunit
VTELFIDAPDRHRLAAELAGRRPGHSLPGRWYTDPRILAADYELVWQREWVFAGHECELAEPGAFLTLTVGGCPLVVVRGDDGILRALHNVCRHRGSVICDQPSGLARHRFVCPYHQWSYELDGRLARARSMAPDFDRDQHGLAPAHCATVGGLVYVCAADDPPPFEPVRALVEPYLAPFDLRQARVAFSSTIVERGNWKLVMENNRECYHCRASHPELSVSFPEAPLHSGGGAEAELRRVDELVERCEAAGLPSRFLVGPDHQYRVMRMPFLGDFRSMTMDGQPAVNRRFGALPADNIGDVLLYHYPSTWNHFTADHAVTFRMLPTGPTTTELRTCWLVPGAAVEGIDYDLERLTAVWRATNAQDTALVERAQRGVASPAYRPGPYAPVEEEGVIQFVDWYVSTVLHRLGA